MDYDESSGWLSEAAMAAYEHVLLTEGWSVGSLGAAAGVPPGEVGGLLDELVRRGLVRPSQEDAGEFAPVAPVVGLRAATQSLEADLLAHVEFVQSVRAATTALVERFEQHRDERLRERVEVLRGRDATVRRIAELLRDSREEVGTVVSSLPSEQALDQARQGDLELLERGVAVRGLFLEGHRRQSAPLRSYLEWMSGQGGEVRIGLLLPSRLMYFDRHTAIVALEPTDTAAGAIVVQSPGLVEVVVTLFDLLWGQARPLEHPVSGTSSGGVELGDVELTVLRLLAQGLKDESVSRRTGLSLRSVRRLISGVSEQLGAHSRFELGMLARDLDLL